MKMTRADASVPAIMVKDLIKSYGRTEAIAGVSASIHAGEIVGLIGDNGAGKSTLIKIISGFERPDLGRIWIDGKEVRLQGPREARRLGIETVYQEQALADDLSVRENLFLGSELCRRIGPLRILDKKHMDKASRSLLQELRLRVDPNQEARFCSGGEKQGVAIARAIYKQARVVILDEPTNALGVVAVTRTLQLIRELGEQGIACLFVSHNIDHIVQVADRILMFVHGRKIVDVHTSETSRDELIEILNSRSGSRT